jgi:uncharacterized protein (TIGR00730 family)
VFGSGDELSETDPLYELAYEVGRRLALSGYRLANGGYDGTMAAASRGAAEAGGEVLGVTVSQFGPGPCNQWVTEELRVDGFPERFRVLCDESDGYIVLPGGVGTLTELGYAWGLLVSGVVPDRPLVALGSAWRTLAQLLRDEEFHIVEERFDYLRFADDPDEAVHMIREAID